MLFADTKVAGACCCVFACLFQIIVVYLRDLKESEMEDVVIPYEFPEKENHSFFFIDQRVDTRVEAKLHRHDAWELYYVVRGRGVRMAGDTLQPFAEGDVVLIPPALYHQWDYDPSSADVDGRVRYLMVAFSHSLVENCVAVFPELRNRLAGVTFPAEALKFGPESSRIIRHVLQEMDGMDEIGRLCGMFRLLPIVFTAKDRAFAGKPVRIERDVRRMQQISAYVMAHYVHPISLDDIAAEVGMNRPAFCSYFKRRKGMTFSRFVAQYRLNTACGLLAHSQKSVSEICYLVGFNDVPHFVRVFAKEKGMPPGKYRRKCLAQARGE